MVQRSIEFGYAHAARRLIDAYEQVV